MRLVDARRLSECAPCLNLVRTHASGRDSAETFAQKVRGAEMTGGGLSVHDAMIAKLPARLDDLQSRAGNIEVDLLQLLDADSSEPAAWPTTSRWPA
jgi:hypothetical protein